MLTSPKNPTIQHIRELQARPRARREHLQFVVEGVRLTEEALAAGIIPLTVIYTSDVGARGETVLAGFRARGVVPTPVSEAVMQAASDTQTPQGILAVLPIQPLPIPPAPSFVLLLDGVRDPGNLGTILRTAAAAGVEAVLLPPETADPFAPKVVRAGMGAHFRVPVHTLGWEQIRAVLAPLSVFVADAGGTIPYSSANFSSRLGMIIGGEARGASAEIESLIPTSVRIPMPGGMESLNAAMAAGILMFEVVRQRTQNK